MASKKVQTLRQCTVTGQVRKNSSIVAHSSLCTTKTSSVVYYSVWGGSVEWSVVMAENNAQHQLKNKYEISGL